MEIAQIIRYCNKFKIGITSQIPAENRLSGYGGEFNKIKVVCHSKDESKIRDLEKSIIRTHYSDYRCKNISPGGTGSLDASNAYSLYVVFS